MSRIVHDTRYLAYRSGEIGDFHPNSENNAGKPFINTSGYFGYLRREHLSVLFTFGVHQNAEDGNP